MARNGPWEDQLGYFKHKQGLNRKPLKCYSHYKYIVDIFDTETNSQRIRCQADATRTNAGSVSLFGRFYAACAGS